MACMRWDMTKAHCQHQCMPWTAASAMCTHRQLHRLVQPAYLLSQQLSHSSSIQRLASSATDLLPPAAQQSQQAPHTCRPLVSNVHNSGASRKLPVCYSTALSSSEATKTAAPGRDKPSTGGTGSNGDNGDDPFNANFGGKSEALSVRHFSDKAASHKSTFFAKWYVQCRLVPLRCQQLLLRERQQFKPSIFVFCG